MARVFFALWPEVSIQGALHNIAKEYQARSATRVMRADTLHMTLCFLGNVERASLPELMQAAALVTAPSFEIALNRLAFWRHNRIAYATTSLEILALDQLVTKLQQALIAAGFKFESRQFVPHVTLLRNIGRMQETQAFAEILWRVDSFVLMESVSTHQGIRYQKLHQWPLVAYEEPVS